MLVAGEDDLGCCRVSWYSALVHVSGIQERRRSM